MVILSLISHTYFFSFHFHFFFSCYLCVLSYNEGMLHDYGVDLMDIRILLFFSLFAFIPLLICTGQAFNKGYPLQGCWSQRNTSLTINTTNPELVAYSKIKTNLNHTMLNI